MPLDKSISKVLIIGSGPITIGQAAEFDYSGTQACKAIMEEGIETILVNSNPATIMTDSNIASKIYIEPLTLDSLTDIIAKERPDGILAGFGGQTSLNLSIELDEAGVLSKYDVKLLGMKRETIKNAEDRDSFKKLMLDINEPIANSIIATDIQECIDFANRIGYPVIIRPAYTLGGTGGGIAYNYDELTRICVRGIQSSPISQILLEQSVAGWKEIEYEVIRDTKDNCIIICNMENMDPVGVHTGDSIVVAPSQTLRDKEYHMLRQASIKIIRSLKIEGGCNIQFALNPYSKEYIVIEVNPRVSRSSALASKAVGYPIAKISAKLSIGYTLNELKNSITQISSACSEPVLDYIVVKFPRWPFDKFELGNRTLGTQMKATGEVMSIDRSFEGAIQKAIHSLDIGSIDNIQLDYLKKYDKDMLFKKISKCDDERLFALAEAFRQDVTIDELHELTMIDKWFLSGIYNIIAMEKSLKAEPKSNIAKAKALGFSNTYIKYISGLDINSIEENTSSLTSYKMVDTCSGEYEALTPYYYSSYGEEDENMITDKDSIVVIGSGPIRIGQGVEFDYCCVHGVWAINEAGYESIMINNNPETVSTDFDTADKLYFEPLSIDYVMDIINAEKPKGVIVQFGGQTSINIAAKLEDNNVPILGTSHHSMDIAEDRDKFNSFLNRIDIPTPKGVSVTTSTDIFVAAKGIGYPVVVRPSYVIGGMSMKVIYDDKSLKNYLLNSRNTNLLIDKYIQGIEIEVDAICDGEEILIPGIMEHIERTGVHSGDSITVYPPQNLDEGVIDKLVKYTDKIATGLDIKGLVNIQYVYDGDNIYVIEVNPRASRTIPILSKVTGVPMVKIAIDAMLGKSLRDQGYGVGLLENKEFTAVKVPIFSNEKLNGVDMYLSPEMKSTGEVLGLGHTFEDAVYKGFKASKIDIPISGGLYVSLSDKDKYESADVIDVYSKMGFKIYASSGTANFLTEKGIQCSQIDTNDILDYINTNDISIILNTPTSGNTETTGGFDVRRLGTQYKIPTFTSLDTCEVFIKAIKMEMTDKENNPLSLDEYVA